ncbi:UDP-N-acetyl-D-glucosamine dehydrogenase [Altererythrobacter xiamenensis]|uniref:UDP-N-acetyl-D-glucosamine dehydrogenase n=1 Tax=Altererythrobacter xiamenensis TaxID=1316679 RepID=A0A1Y6F2J4_9SPHN|nr:nucleotide sugar dehydrogenase [Altererythrobacter xiamenensis]SMQ69065.1 UDP-N-acetyl-D-glucosamine dehydrogenase [Altererythrobacter xiamenensis]
MSENFNRLLERIESRDAKVGILGMGYVGLPLSVAAFDAGFPVLGFDVDETKIASLNAAQSPIERVANSRLATMREEGLFEVTSDFSRTSECDLLIICVPTPLGKHREPDLSYVVQTVEAIKPNLRKGQLVSLESTTYPGTSRDLIKPILESTGLESGADFFIAYSPEREDPGNPDFETRTIPKVVGGDGDHALQAATAFYGAVVEKAVPVSSCEVAEAVKLTENIFRSVNIALVNELKIIYARLGINVWDVIDAAATKPFGFMPFYPGPGLGGHCIPIDPFYLTWRAREFQVPTRFIELAGEVNLQAPYFVIEEVAKALSDRKHKSVAGSRILLLGVAYKKNVEDTRESPGFVLIEELERRGAKVDFYDPYVPVIPNLREHPEMVGRKSEDFDPENFSEYDAILLCTDHDNVDYEAIAERADLIVDTRNVFDHSKNNIVQA